MEALKTLGAIALLVAVVLLFAGEPGTAMGLFVVAGIMLLIGNAGSSNSKPTPRATPKD